MKKEISSIPFHDTPEQAAALSAVIDKNKHDSSRLMGVMQEAQEIAPKYPGLDLQQELNNPQFFSALMNGASVEGAYWGLYHDQLIPQAMQYTAQETERKIANKIQAQGQRPTENGAKAPINVKSDVSQLSDADMDEIIKRARRGEKIRF